MKKILSVLFFSLFLLSCGDAISSNKVENMSVEQKLASLDANSFVEKDDTKAVRIKILLNQLSEIYREPVDTIAEYTSKAQSVIQEKGVEESNLNILEEMNKAGKIENTPYKDAVVFYALMRIKGV